MSQRGKAILILFLGWVVVFLWIISGLRAQSQDPPPIFGGAVRQAGQSLSGVVWPRADTVFLTTGNSLRIQRACKFGFDSVKVSGVLGQLIGIDYRPSNGLLYGLDDQGILYTIDGNGSATPAGALTVPFAADMRSLMDFNPVADALRLIGANDQNYAVVGNLATTVPQAAIRYATGDVNQGVNPNLVGGAYTNNVAGATRTIFYGVDYDLDTLVGIAPPLVGAGSSNTGGGQIQTIGRLGLDLDETADLDIYTVAGVNKLIGVSRGRVFSVDLGQINPNLPVGQTQELRVRSLPLPGAGDFIDVAVGPQTNCQ